MKEETGEDKYAAQRRFNKVILSDFDNTNFCQKYF